MSGRKKPLFRYQWEPLDLENYTEAGVEKGARMEGVTNPDVLAGWKLMQTHTLEEAFEWLDVHQYDYQTRTYDIDTVKPSVVAALKPYRPEFIFNRRSLNEIPYIDNFLASSNEALVQEGYLFCHATTSRMKERIIHERFGPVLGPPICALHYFWHRFCPKMPILKRVYYLFTRRTRRSFNRVEILGRFVRAGFCIADEEFLHGEFFVLGRKVREPIKDEPPQCKPIIKLRRVGKNGALIGVYKFRTMYSYSEYLQEYMYEHGGLQEGGKFREDCRINFWGRILRKTFLDELPMVINLLKGQVKLVGVRPLSRQYFSLYTPEMQALHIKVKPGLIPPFYYEKQTPASIEDVQQSERRYIESYLAHPFRTDWRYFWGSIFNIIFHHKKSN